jgi:hypothetical protein
VVVLLAAVTPPCRLVAQDRLVGERVVGIGASFDAIRFSGAGLQQSNFSGLDSTRVRSLSQMSIPVTAVWPVGGGWRMDATALYAAGTVTFADATAAGGERRATLRGTSDMRLRASGPMLREGLLATIGVNLPAGQTSLNGEEFSALRILSAPALGVGSSPVGAGLSGTVGVVSAHDVGRWAIAAGLSYEVRGTFQPVAALSAGAPSTEFRPGGVVRGSLAADRVIGAHRLNLAFAADAFGEDRLQGDASAGDAVARVRLGPVFSSDIQLYLGVRHFRELLVYGSHRWRAPYARDGVTVNASSGSYVDIGTRGAVRVTPSIDIFSALDGRWHSGLGVDQGLPTAGVRSGSVTLGGSARRGPVTAQPYVRLQAGSLSQRGAEIAVPRQGFAGVVPGFVLFTRF